MSITLVPVDSEALKMKNNNIDLKPNEISEGTKKSLKVRVISALVALVIALPSIFIGDWLFYAFVTFISIVAFWEIVHCGKGSYSFWLYFVTILLGVVMVNWPLFQGLINNVASNGHIFDYYNSLNLSLVPLFIGVCLLFLVVILHENFTVRDGCYIIAIVVVVSLGLQSALFLRCFPSYINANPRTGWFNGYDHFLSCTFIIYGIIGTFMTDIGAYFVGVFFGKHKINERISPKKTYEGFWGGIIISAILSMTYAFIFAACGNPILPGIFDLAHWYNIVFMSLLMPFLATLGDFVFSAIKRFYDIKDFGNIMPGHGGVLDRVDSIIFVFSGLALYTLLFYGLSGMGGATGLFV